MKTDMGKYNTTEIVICPHCNGEGELREDIRDNLYESHIKIQRCPLCNGKRVVNKVITYQEVNNGNSSKSY